MKRKIRLTGKRDLDQAPDTVVIPTTPRYIESRRDISGRAPAWAIGWTVQDDLTIRWKARNMLFVLGDFVLEDHPWSYFNAPEDEAAFWEAARISCHRLREGATFTVNTVRYTYCSGSPGERIFEATPTETDDASFDATEDNIDMSRIRPSGPPMGNLGSTYTDPDGQVWVRDAHSQTGWVRSGTPTLRPTPVEETPLTVNVEIAGILSDQLRAAEGRITSHEAEIRGQRVRIEFLEATERKRKKADKFNRTVGSLVMLLIIISVAFDLASK